MTLQAATPQNFLLLDVDGVQVLQELAPLAEPFLIEPLRAATALAAADVDFRVVLQRLYVDGESNLIVAVTGTDDDAVVVEVVSIDVGLVLHVVECVSQDGAAVVVGTKHDGVAAGRNVEVIMVVLCGRDEQLASLTVHLDCAAHRADVEDGGGCVLRGGHCLCPFSASF